ncbi:achaete-scute homolog 1a-like [Tubulanus polymorphus]|uniref:achaete-scute homolog 1a-like n=1 Tax=Tubulanus polymorphus TaxID=672921 RepID=UPI003DA4C1B4
MDRLQASVALTPDRHLNLLESVSPTLSTSSKSSKKSLKENNEPDLLRCKRRIDFPQTAVKRAAVARRNERERNRVKLVNLGFATLRDHVPQAGKNKKMSKVETLRSAVDYIKYLRDILTDQHDGVKGLAAKPGKDISPPHSVESLPSPGYASDSSFDHQVTSPEDDELLDFASWFQ